MQTSSDLVLSLGLFYLFILLGFLFIRFSNYGEKGNKVVTQLLIYILLPILIFQTILSASTESLAEVPIIIFVTLLMHLSGFGILFIITRKRHTGPRKGAMLLCATFNNGIFLPVPLILMFIGEPGVALVAFFSITQMMLFATLGGFIGSSYSTEDSNLNEQIRKVLLFPPFIAAMAALLFGSLGFVIPVEALPVLSINGAVTSYLALFAVGLGIGTSFSMQDFRAALEVFSVRQIIVPVLIAYTLSMMMLSSLTKQVMFLEALMPPAVITVVYAANFELDTEIAATAVTVGTLLLLPLVPFLPFILGLF